MFKQVPFLVFWRCFTVYRTDGYAVHKAALRLLERKQKGTKRRITIGADKACDPRVFVAAAQRLNLTAYMTRTEKARRSNLDRGVIRPPGYALNLRGRWLVEKSFGVVEAGRLYPQVKLRRLHNVD